MRAVGPYRESIVFICTFKNILLSLLDRLDFLDIMGVNTPPNKTLAKNEYIVIYLYIYIYILIYLYIPPITIYPLISSYISLYPYISLYIFLYTYNLIYTLPYLNTPLFSVSNLSSADKYILRNVVE